MKGFLQKNLLVMKGNIKIYGLVFLFILLVTMLSNSEEGSMMGGCVGAVTAAVIMTLVNSFGYDDRAGWDAYAFALPVARRDMVRGKYLFSFAVNGVGALIAGAVGIVVSIARHSSLLEALTGALGSLAGGLFLTAILMPVIYRFGLQRMIVILFPLFGVIGSLSLGSYLISKKLPIGSVPPAIWMVAGLVLLAGFLIGSYSLSCRILEQKEV